MKAIIWKEWREQLPYAGSALLAVSLICAWMLHQALTANSSWNAVWTQGVMMPFTILAPMIAAIMGALQIVPELKRDQWAFLIHRPIALGTIFWGKVLAGLSLYFLMMLLPLAGVALWLSRPGHTPGPFIGQMFLVPIADILSGIVFYFAAILATLRLTKSRLSYMRIAAFVFALGCAALSAFVTEFWQSLLVVTLGVLVVGSAAWGSFVSLDSYEKQPAKARAGLIVSLYIGIAATIIAGVALIVSMMPTAPSNYSHTQYRVAKSGRVIKVTQSPDGMTATDLQGKALQSLKGKNLDDSDLINESNIYLETQARRVNGYRLPERYVLPISGMNHIGNANWFFLINRGWFEAYSPQTRLREGFLGPDGFSPSPPQRRFAGNLQSSGWRSQLFQFADAAYWIDFSKRRLNALHQTVSGKADFASLDMASNSYLDNSSWGAVVVANHQIRFFSKQGQLRFAVPLEFAPEDYPFLSISPVSEQKLILQQNGYRKTNGEYVSLPIQVREVSGRGEVLKRYQLPPIKESNNHTTTEPYSVALLVPPGAVATVVAYWGVGNALGDETAARDWQAVKDNTSMFWMFTLFAVLAALPCAFAAWRFGLHHQVSLKTRWTWAISVFWTGLFGLLTLLVLREWPPRIPCETCGKKRSVALETCASCHASWPPPPLDGTEIFA
jgi:ABC-type transport system involved in multi-copper enzyme maturation permease subunit